MSHKYYKPGYISGIDSLPSEGYNNFFILGTAEQGPINQPVRIKSEEELFNVFGNKGTMQKAYSQIKAGYPEDYKKLNIYTVKISGEYSYVNIQNRIIFESVTTDIGLEGSFVEIMDENIIFQYPNMNKQLVYKISERGLVDKINSDENNPVIVLDQADDIANLSEGIYHFTSPRTGLDITKNQQYLCLMETYGLLEGLRIGTIIPVGAYVDDNHPAFLFSDYSQTTDVAILSNEKDYLNLNEGLFPARFYKQLQTFCKTQLIHGIATHGVMGYAPNSTKHYDNTYVSKASEIILYQDFKKEGYMISIFLGDIKLPNGDIDNGYIIYGAMLSKIAPQESPTNMKLPTTIEYLDNFDDNDLKLLFSEGIVTYRYSVLSGYVIFSGVTYSNPESKFFFIDDFRVAGYVVYKINKALKEFIGTPLELLISNKTLARKIEDELRSMVDKEITKYEFRIIAEQGECTIPISITTIHTLQKLDIDTGFKIKSE